MWRGIETILAGRDPRDAWIFTQRICGVCTTVHAIASVRAVENALGMEIPPNAQHIRNLLVAAHALHDHIVHFYQLSALDWVDVPAALKGDPAKAASIAEGLSPWPRNGRREMEAVKTKLASFVKGGRLGIFANGYWGHPAMRLSPEMNLVALSHYLQALDAQRKANQAVAILGGKTPHIQNLAVGGVANAINLDDPATLNMEKLYKVKDLLAETAAFVQQVYLPDVCVDRGEVPRVAQLRSGRRQLPRRAGPAPRRGGDAIRPPRRDDFRREARDVKAISPSGTDTSRRTCRRASPAPFTRGTGGSTPGRRRPDRSRRRSTRNRSIHG